MPYTERREQLKIYGDADVTVSDTNARVAPVAEGNAEVGAD